MDLTSGRGHDQHRAEPRSALRREMVQSLLVLAVLIGLAIVAKLPAN